MTPRGHNDTIEMIWQYGTIDFFGGRMAEKPVKDYDKFNLRFPDGMREAIAERAKRHGRSMNSEIIQILQDVIDEEKLEMVTSKESIDSMDTLGKLKYIGVRTEKAKAQIKKSYEKIEENNKMLEAYAPEIADFIKYVQGLESDIKNLEQAIAEKTSNIETLNKIVEKKNP